MMPLPYLLWSDCRSTAGTPSFPIASRCVLRLNSNACLLKLNVYAGANIEEEISKRRVVGFIDLISKRGERERGSGLKIGRINAQFFEKHHCHRNRGHF